MGHEVLAAGIGATAGALVTLVAVHLLHKVNREPGSDCARKGQVNSSPAHVEASASPKVATATNGILESSGDAAASAAINGSNDAPSSSSGSNTAACSLSGAVPSVQVSRSAGDIAQPFHFNATQTCTYGATVLSGSGAAASSSQPRAIDARKEFDAAKADEAPRRETGLKGSRMLYGKANGTYQWKVTLADGCDAVEQGATRRLVLEKDVLKWLDMAYLDDLKSFSGERDNFCFVASIPDITEFLVPDEKRPGKQRQLVGLEEYQELFMEVARKIMDATPEGSCSIFLQSDIKYSARSTSSTKDLNYDTWVSKFALVHRAAEKVPNCRLVWHRIVLRSTPVFGLPTAKPGDVLIGKPGRPQFSHLFCFSRGGVEHDRYQSPEVFYKGDQTWARGIGFRCCDILLDYLQHEKPNVTTVVSLFAGEGLLLALANARGMHALGVELSHKRAKKARRIQVTKSS